VVVRVEKERTTISLHAAVASARQRSRRRPARSSLARAQLRRAIAFVDSRFFREPNCVRRALLEMTLDRGAAREPLLAGFMAGGGPKSGHAWLLSDPVSQRYDGVLSI